MSAYLDKLNTKKNKAKVLDVALKLLSKEGSWCKGAYSKNKKGHWSIETAKDTVSRCAMGALRAASRKVLKEHMFAGCVATDLEFVLPENESLTGWNDRPTTTHADVVDLFTNARYGLYE